MADDFDYEDRTAGKPWKEWIEQRYGCSVAELQEQQERLRQWRERQPRKSRAVNPAPEKPATPQPSIRGLAQAPRAQRSADAAPRLAKLIADIRSRMDTKDDPLAVEIIEVLHYGQALPADRCAEAAQALRILAQRFTHYAQEFESIHHRDRGRLS